MDILTFGDAALVQKAAPVRHIGPEYRAIAEEMLELMARRKGVGLAGPQTGLLERLFVVRAGDGVGRVFINPAIIAVSEDRVGLEEGCLSLPGVWARVTRPRAVKVQAWNESGRPFTLETAGMLARIIQHECDHLDGVLFTERLPENKRAQVIARYEKRRLQKPPAQRTY